MPVANRHDGGGQTVHVLARGLGWFSIGLGITELLAPYTLARYLGMLDRASLVRAYGAREIVAGIGILSQRDPAPWVWARVGGDALDLATLATGLRKANPQKNNVVLATLAVAAVTLLDVICAQVLRSGHAAHAAPDYSTRRGFPRPPEEVRGVARDAEMPRDMRTPETLRPYTYG
jgi:hypothetical protein